jgi:hypothetical protein
LVLKTVRIGVSLKILAMKYISLRKNVNVAHFLNWLSVEGVFGSFRFPNAVLIRVNGKPLLCYIF